MVYTMVILWRAPSPVWCRRAMPFSGTFRIPRDLHQFSGAICSTLPAWRDPGVKNADDPVDEFRGEFEQQETGSGRNDER